MIVFLFNSIKAGGSVSMPILIRHSVAMHVHTHRQFFQVLLIEKIIFLGAMEG